MRHANTLFFSVILLPAFALAQNPQFDEAQIQQMMQEAQKMQQCMDKLDQQAMQKLADDAQAMGQEIEALCKKGKRDAAKNLAMEFGLKMSEDVNFKQAQKCGEGMQKMLPKNFK